MMGMQRFPRALRLAAGALVVLLAGFVAGVAADEAFAPQLGYSALQPASARGKFDVFWEVWNLASQRYVDATSVRPNQMVDAAINGMLTSLGDVGHTRYLNVRDAKFEEEAIKGRYVGIGAEVRNQGGTTTIVTIFDGSPAQRAGLRSGDAITRVDGTSTNGLSLGQVTSQTRGKAGTSVRLSIRRPGLGQEFEVTLVRSEITLPSVSWLMLPGTSTALLRVRDFSQNAGPDLHAALDELHQAGATGLILDLRENPGGLVDQTVRVASEFLDENATVYIDRGRDGHRTVQHTVRLSQGKGLALGDRLVVLVDAGTASAAEILAGALQDNGRARLVGETTVGTGTVLSTYRLRNGGTLLLGTQEWLTPKGTPIKGRGIKPDQVVTLPASVQPLFPNEARTLTPEEFRSRADPQLRAAISALQAGS